MKIFSSIQSVIIITFLFITAGKAQNLFDFDYAQFGYDSTSNYLEFYYSFNQSTMKVSPSDSMKVVEGILQISIEDTSSGQKIVDKEWRVSHQVSDSGEGWRQVSYWRCRFYCASWWLQMHNRRKRC